MGSLEYEHHARETGEKVATISAPHMADRGTTVPYTEGEDVVNIHPSTNKSNQFAHYMNFID
jgi:hypothetical protein